MSWLEGLRENEAGREGTGVVGSLAPALDDTSTVCQAAPRDAASVPPCAAPADPGPSAPSLLYIATELESWETNRPEPDQDDICERCGYRRLDPPYYAWLRSMMVRARQAHQRAQLPDAEYELLRTRFNAIHVWALARFGEEALRAAVTQGVPSGYRPPTVWMPEDETPPTSIPQHIYPADGDWPFPESVLPEAVAQVDAIREQALALGWSEAALYQNRGRLRFPVGGHYGLVCFLPAGSEIGEVVEHSIVIVMPSGSRLRHYNRSVLQPWVRRDGPEKVPAISDTSRLAPVCNQ